MSIFNFFKKDKSNEDTKVIDNNKIGDEMQTIAIKLDSRKLEKANLDLIYILPEKIEEYTNGRVEDNGYDYLSNTEIAVFLKTKTIDNAKDIIDLFNKERICDCDLSKSAEIYVSKNANEDIEKCKKIYPI